MRISAFGDSSRRFGSCCQWLLFVQSDGTCPKRALGTKGLTGLRQSHSRNVVDGRGDGRRMSTNKAGNVLAATVTVERVASHC